MAARSTTRRGGGLAKRRTSETQPLSVAFLGTYVPRQCGIATFTRDLGSAVADLLGEPLGTGPGVRVLAVNDTPAGYPYGDEVRFELRHGQKADYREAADFLNVSSIDLLCLQHEYGIFGGDDGVHILQVLGNLKKPVVTTLHTVLREPSPGQREVLQRIARLSTFVVVMAERAARMLEEIYGVPPAKIRMIHHGVPDVPFMDPGFYKDQFHVEGRRVILTFGLLGPNKGIEIGIDALARLVPEFPDLVYIVLGATHPELRRRVGEEYRVSLERRARERGVQDHILFHNRYVTLEELCEFLLAADIYLTPYRSREQIASGTLAYAIGCGKACVSTPYWYAEEVLSDGRGRIFPFDDADALVETLRDVLNGEVERNQMRKRAYLFGRQMIWREVARAYLRTFEDAIANYARQIPRLPARAKPIPKPGLPEVSLDHLRILTDGTGIIQHATYATPDRRHGYTTDDNARALIVAILNVNLFGDESVLPLVQTYLAFLRHAFVEETRRFRNFLSYERHWLEDTGSDDSQGRAIWALGTAVAFPPNNSILGLSSRLFEAAFPALEGITSPRAWAFALLGIHAFLRRFSGASEARRMRERLAQRLLHHFRENAAPDWPWCEPTVTYGNATLPHALLLSGRWLECGEMVEQGLRSLAWLFEIQSDPAGHLTLIGNAGWYPRGGKKARFDQQPIEAAKLVLAAQEAFQITRERNWLVRMRHAVDWFLGANDIRAPLYDFQTRGCCDGLHPTGTNINQGAESTLAWLLSIHAAQLVEEEGLLWPEAEEETEGVTTP
ncbi:MAG: glycosyltransferase family 4 protein [Planctomycetes bacterium]|nr:glycosyltransferase family 4 protein [Planctomycetota bacterium]